jgi:integrase
MAYIIRRGALYYLNLRLPKYHSRHCHTLRMSLGLRERKAALFLACSLANQVHNQIACQPLIGLAELRVLCATWMADTPTPAVSVSATKTKSSTQIRTPASGPSLSTLSKLYIEEGKRGGTWRTVSTFEVERALRDLFELLGDMPASAFDVEQARTLKDRLSRCPQYFELRPEFKGKALLQVVESDSTYKTITATTVNNRLRKLSAFLNWCKANGYVKENPLSGLKVMTGSAKDARLSFEHTDLCKLLDPSNLRTEARKHPWRYWLPLLGRFTGARLEELCQLHIDDITEVQGILCIQIDDNRDDQNLKNSSSRRVIPIHPELIKLGLLDYVEIVKATGAARLFTELQPTRGKLGHAPSKWFGRYKTKLGITDPKKTFHSFRHTFIDELRDAGVQDSLIKRMVGHEDSSVTFGIYGSRTPVKAMLEAIQHITG